MRTLRVLTFFLIIFMVNTLLYAQNKTRIAVLSFEAKNVNQETAEAVADILSTELFNTNRFDVIERQAINKILEEQKLQMTGITDMSQAAEIGKMLNVEKILIGSVSRLGQTYIINTRLVGVETGALELAENTKSQGGEDGLPTAIAQLVSKISQKITLEGTIIKVNQNVVLIDLGKNHGIKKDQMLDVIRIGDVITDLSGAAIGTSEDLIGILKVINVKNEYSEAQIKQSKVMVRLGDKVRLSTTVIGLKQDIRTTPQPEIKEKQVKEEKKQNDKKPVELPPVF
ncbi:hypothetical protein JXQ31_09725 [candidate division KSB1 bacterium]|nr:hypothetical protein [candidate division KSB1 bacterium]